MRQNAADPSEQGDVEGPIFDLVTCHTILFIEVTDPTPCKNRIHFDLRPCDGTRDDEVARLTGLGAHFVADRGDIHSSGNGWVTLADPEGNQFCVLRSKAEKQ